MSTSSTEKRSAAPRSVRRLSHILRQFIKKFQTKGKQKWQPCLIFISTGRHILQMRILEADNSPDVIKRFGDASVMWHICIKRTNDCLLWFAGLNSPAWGGEKKKAWHFLQQSSCLRWMLCSCSAIISRVDVNTDAQWKLLFPRLEIRIESLSFLRYGWAFPLQLLHHLKRRRSHAGALRVREKSKKRQRNCIERPTYLNQREEKYFIKD